MPTTEGDRARVEAHIAELRRRGTARRDAVKGFRGARVKDERSKADAQLALADAIERLVNLSCGAQAGGGTGTTCGVSGAAQPGDCPSSGESGTASPGPAAPCEFCAESFPCEKCATPRLMTTQLALELASVAMAVLAGECPCNAGPRRCGSCLERSAADQLFSEWLRDLTPGVTGLEPDGREWWRCVARKLGSDYSALIRELEDTRRVRDALDRACDAHMERVREDDNTLKDMQVELAATRQALTAIGKALGFATMEEFRAHAKPGEVPATLIVRLVRERLTDAERWEYLRDALEHHEQITVTATRERDNRSVMVECGRTQQYSTPNYLGAGDDAPGIGSMLDEALDLARSTTEDRER